jgi:hypothetical protein
VRLAHRAVGLTLTPPVAEDDEDEDALDENEDNGGDGKDDCEQVVDIAGDGPLGVEGVQRQVLLGARAEQQRQGDDAENGQSTPRGVACRGRLAQGGAP